MRKFVIKMKAGLNRGEYWLARFYGTTPDISRAFVYDADSWEVDSCRDNPSREAIPVESEAEKIARLELELSQSQRIRNAQHGAITSLGRQVDVLKGALARRADSDCGNIIDLRRQNADLQAANNALLQRARDAEQRAEILASRSPVVAFDIDGLAAQIHKENEKWWTDPATGKRIERNKGEMIALMHSELSEMLEGVRKDSMDDHLPQFKSEVVELADEFLRGLDYAGAYGLPLHAAIQAKRAYNRTRKDHTHEARLAAGGKRF